MKFFGLTLKKMILLGLLGAVLTISAAAMIDPTDDLSFSLHAVEGRAHRLMSVRRVAHVLGDRLDLFPQSQVPKLAKHLVSLCDEYRFDPAFILSLIEVESRFRTRVVSPMGAVGLMQLMPATAVVIARDRRPELVQQLATPGKGDRMLRDPFLNLELGVAYLAWLRDRYRGFSPYYLVAAYNIGPARLDELLSRKSFKPVNTKRYYEAIRKGVPEFRFYRKRPAQHRI